MLALALIMVVIPLSILNSKYPMGITAHDSSTEVNALYLAAVKRNQGRRAAKQKRVKQIDEEEEDDDEYYEDDKQAEAAAKKGSSKPTKRGPLRAQEKGAPVRGDGGVPPAAAAPSAAPLPVKKIDSAPVAAAPAAPKPAEAAPAVPAAAAKEEPSVVPTHHPVLFPARYASGDAVPESGCEAKWGNSYLRDFLTSRRDSCKPNYDAMPEAARGAFRNYHGLLTPDSGVGPKQAVSRVTSWSSHTGANFHWMRNIAVDFSRASVSGDQRRFQSGFITGACVPDGLAFTSAGDQPALGGWQTTPNGEPLSCEEWVHTPTLVVQHDDIGNTYHNLADFWRLWVGLAIAQQPACVPAADLPNDPTRYAAPPWAQFPPSHVKAADAAFPGADAKRACPEGTVEVAGVNPDAAQIMTLDGR